MAPHVGGREVEHLTQSKSTTKTDQLCRLVGKETGYKRDSRLGKRESSALQFSVRFARRVGDGHPCLLQPGQNLGLGERGRLGREVDVRVRIESRSTSSSPATSSSSSPHAWTGLDAMRDGPVVEGDHL